MIKERYERMLKKYGPDDAGTIQAKRQLDEQMKAVQGEQAMEDDRRRTFIIQLIPKAPKTKSTSKPPETPPQNPTPSSED